MSEITLQLPEVVLNLSPDTPTLLSNSSTNFAESMLPMTTTVDSAPPFDKQLYRLARKYPKITNEVTSLFALLQTDQGWAIKSSTSVTLSTKCA